MIDLFPIRTWHRADQPVVIALEADAGDRVDLPGASLVVTRLGTLVRTVPVAGAGATEVGTYPLGGYGVDLVGRRGQLLASTAFDVLTSPFDRPRYGFVTSFGPNTAAEAVRRNFQRLHLNLAQYYDWAYRHTLLLPPDQVGQSYLDPLGHPVSMPKLGELIQTLRQVGTANLGYAAVYAIEPDEIDRWAAHTLYRADGSAHALGDPAFLFIADPSDGAWLDYLVPQFRRAFDELGFDGFHLDQYGSPKFGLRADGSVVDVADAFMIFLKRVAEEVPEAALIFNNVNGFGLVRTARAGQAALYTEVWPPRTRLGDLAAHIAASRAAACTADGVQSGPLPSDTAPSDSGPKVRPLPSIIAAYLSAFAGGDPRLADNCAKLAMATIFSSGATHLLAGEHGAVLTDPYYPNHHQVDQETDQMLQRWYSFLVRYGDLLLAPDLEDVTGQVFGAYNGDIVVSGPAGLTISAHPDPGAIWVRVMRSGRDLVVHLINLTGQDDADWDAPKGPIAYLRDLTLRVERGGSECPVWWFAAPDQPGPMRQLQVAIDGRTAVADLPPFGAWALLYLPAAKTTRAPIQEAT